MEFDLALRLTELLLALAFLQHSAEHLTGPHAARALFLTRAVLSLALLAGVQSDWMLLALTVHSLAVLHRYNGPYNGGSDRMGLLILYCLTLSHWLPHDRAAQAAFAYLGVQVILSYVISGGVKLLTPEWRSGAALRDVFTFSSYPVAQNVRGIATYPQSVFYASWAVMLFEVLFPLALLDQWLLGITLVLAAGFHIVNSCLFGLNRFVWVWIAAYPSLFWLQTQVAIVL